MGRLGTVVEVRGDRVRISTSRRGVCDNCADKSACSAGETRSKTSEIIEALSSVAARPGDVVDFDLPGHTELHVSLVIWGVPLLGLVAGAALGSVFHAVVGMEQDPAALACGGVGLLLAFGVVKLVDLWAAGNDRLLPRVHKVVDTGGGDGLGRGHGRC